MKARFLSATVSTSNEAFSESYFGNIYLDALLWLTPTNPFGTAQNTTIKFSFGSADYYPLFDPESTVDLLHATNWDATVGPQTSVHLLNGDVISIPGGWTGEQAATYVALKAWANVANITLQCTNAFDCADFKFLVTDESGMREYFSGEKGVLGFSELPNNYGVNYGSDPDDPYSPGYAVFNQDGYGWTSKGLMPGGYGYVTILHEIGHLFGLDHPWDEGGHYIKPNGSIGEEPFFPGATASNKIGDYGLNQGVFTTMTYNDGWKEQPSKSTDWGYQMGPGAFDIAAIQKLYGANMSYHAGPDTYMLPGTNTSGTGWFTLWDAGGVDKISVPPGAGSATIDLRAATLRPEDPGAGGYVSWVKGIAGGFTIANGVIIENADGGAGKDTIIGNGANNHIVGGGAKDILTGGAGSDTFVFLNLSDSLAGAKHDVITDFTPGCDVIDLSGLDNSPAPGTQHFTIDEISFTGGLLSGDVNKDGKADFQVELTGVAALNWSHDVLLA